MGYYEYNPEKQVIFFKIKEVNKKSKRKMGIVCNNDGMKKDQIIDFINTLSGKPCINLINLTFKNLFMYTFRIT